MTGNFNDSCTHSQPPTAKDAEHLTHLRHKASEEIRKAKKRVWDARCDEAASAADLGYTFNLIRELDGRAQRSTAMPLAKEGTPFTCPREKANYMAEHLATVNRGTPLTTKPQRHKIRSVKTTTPAEDIFTLAELKTCIGELKKKKSTGPDGVHNEWLQHLGEGALRALLHVCNLSWTTAVLPEAWTTATVIPLHKKGKDMTDPASYRPISLTSSVSKVMEKLVKRRMHQLMSQPNSSVNNLHSAQAGFRSLRSTSDQLQLIVQSMHNTCNNKRSGVLLTCDMEKAFDRVCRKRILKKMHEMGFPPRYTNWVTNYLTNRVSRVSVQGHLSDPYISEDGVPQGTVLAPLLFNLVMDDLAIQLSRHGDDVIPALFADDVAILVTGNTMEDAVALAQTVFSEVEGFTGGANIRLSASKTTWMPVSAPTRLPKDPVKLQQVRDRQQREDELSIHFLDGSLLKRDLHPRYLGLILDRSGDMKAHFDMVVERFSCRMSILHSLAGTDWGCDAHTLRAAYLSYVYPTITYAASVYGSRLSATHIDTLEKLHRKAAKAITGCDYMTHGLDVLWEAHLQTVACHLRRVAANDYEKFMRLPDSPGHAAALSTTKPPGRTWLSEATDTIDDSKAYRHSERALLCEHDPVCPREWEELSQSLRITPTIPGINKSSGMPADIMLLRAEETLAALPNYDVHVYTDGSCQDVSQRVTAADPNPPVHQRGGAGAVFYAGDRLHSHTKELQTGAGTVSSSYQAELVAICLGLEGITTWDAPAEVLLLTDSQSALMALASGPCGVHEDTLHRLWRLLHSRAREGYKLHLHYIPSHVGVLGNEAADKLASRANNSPANHERISLASIRACVKRRALSREPTPSERSIYSYKSGSTTALHRPALRTPHLTRLGATTIRNLRVERHPLVYNKLHPDRTAYCPRCSEEASLRHIFSRCSNPATPRSSLPSTNLGQLMQRHEADVLRFLCEAGYLDDEIESLMRH